MATVTAVSVMVAEIVRLIVVLAQFVKKDLDRKLEERSKKRIEKVNHRLGSLGHELPADRKTEFANHVLREGTPEYFTHFQDLHVTVSRILGPVA